MTRIVSAVKRQPIRAIVDTVMTKQSEILLEVHKAAQILKRCTVDMIAYFDRAAASSGRTEVDIGRLQYFAGAL